jgi:hypothetical protein
MNGDTLDKLPHFSTIPAFENSLLCFLVVNLKLKRVNRALYFNAINMWHIHRYIILVL